MDGARQTHALTRGLAQGGLSKPGRRTMPPGRPREPVTTRGLRDKTTALNGQIGNLEFHGAPKQSVFLFYTIPREAQCPSGRTKPFNAREMGRYNFIVQTYWN